MKMKFYDSTIYATGMILIFHIFIFSFFIFLRYFYIVRYGTAVE